VTATALLVRFFRRNNVEPFVRLPHRVRDGYGLKRHIIKEMRTQGVTLLITVDAGISSIEEVHEAQESGMDTIITDHHHPHAQIPPAYAIVHPALSPRYPRPHPSGSGVAFALVRALEGTEEWEGHKEDLCLAMLGTVADVMELTGANRTLVTAGLTALKHLPAHAPIAKLCAQAGVDRSRVTARDIAYRIAPRINAAGRLEDPGIALQALLSGESALAHLGVLNAQRQDLTASLLADVLSSLHLSTENSPQNVPPLLAAASVQYPEGIVGLLAGKLTEGYGKPSIVACIRGDACIASLRSVPAYHVTEGLERVEGLLTTYGGHAQAAGCTFPTKNYPELIARLLDDISARVRPQDLVPTLPVDAVLSPQNITRELAQALGHLEPFGEGNPEPLFFLPNVSLSAVRTVGNDSRHLQCSIGTTKAVGFQHGHLRSRLNEPLDLLCRIGLNRWNGRTDVQLFIEDMRHTECSKRNAASEMQNAQRILHS